MKKYLFTLITIISLTLQCFQAPAYADENNNTAKGIVKGAITSLAAVTGIDPACFTFQDSAPMRDPNDTLSGGGVIPDTLLHQIYQTIRRISDTTADVMVMGQALTCHAIYADKKHIDIPIVGGHLISYPNISGWIGGVIVYFFGFMMTLSITFYLVDVGFKLGFAVIMLPIGIALWPFPWTKDKLVIIISIILKCAGIFAFLSLTVAYAYELLNTSLEGTDMLYQSIDNNKLDYVDTKFSLSTTNFLLVLFALAYGMKLIGSTIKDYVDQFFPDQVFGGASPIHGSMTQAMDFAKKKVVDPVASYAKDVAMTQTGNVMKFGGRLMTGKYNQQIRKMGHYAANPGEAADKGIQAASRLGGIATQKIGKGVTGALSGTLGRLVLGKNASNALKNSMNQKIDSAAQKINKAGQDLGAKVNKNITAHTDSIKQNIKQSAVGQKVSAAAGAVNSAAHKITNPVQNFMQRRQNRIDQIQSDKENRIDSIEAKKQRRFARIEKFQKKVNNGIDTITGAGFIKKQLNKANNKRQNTINRINQKYKANEGDSLLNRGYKAAVRGTRKAWSNAAYGAKAAVGYTLTSPAAVLKTANAGLMQVAKVPARAASGWNKNRARLNSGRKKFIHRTGRTFVKAVDIHTYTNAVGNVMMSVGDQMTRRGKTEEQRAAEKEKIETENLEYEERKRREEESEN